MEPREDLLSIELPKWPAMVVRGQPVSYEQAREIIRRTDSYFDGHVGNDRAWAAEVAQRLRFPGDEDRKKPYKEYRDALQGWQDRWGFVRTEYVRNSWISCAVLGGPRGWCHPTGLISFDQNIGKYPEVREVLSDWRKIAEAFPFLDLTATVMDREQSEGEDAVPLVTIVVVCGEASLTDPMPAKPAPRNIKTEVMQMLQGVQAERGIPYEWIDDWERFERQLPAM